MAMKIDGNILRHRLDGAHPIARPFRLDLFLAGDQRDLARPRSLRRDAIVNFTRQQPQWQSDHTGLVTEHPLDRQMRLTRVLVGPSTAVT